MTSSSRATPRRPRWRTDRIEARWLPAWRRCAAATSGLRGFKRRVGRLTFMAGSRTTPKRGRPGCLHAIRAVERDASSGTRLRAAVRWAACGGAWGRGYGRVRGGSIGSPTVVERHRLAQMIKKISSCARCIAQIATVRSGGPAPLPRDRPGGLRIAGTAQRLRLSGATAAWVRVQSSRPSSAGAGAAGRRAAPGTAGPAGGVSTSPSRSSSRVRARCGWRR